MIRHAALAVLLLLPASVLAQTQPGPPGPYVIDLRGAMIAVPNAGEFYPTLPAEGTVPGRAFGLDVGAHVLAKRLGGSRLGFGANVLFARGKVGPPDVSARVTAVAPQVSLSFGTADGWSNISAGYGVGRISTRVSASDSESSVGEMGDLGEAGEVGKVDTGSVGTINFGGGVRWFVRPHMAAGFDVRFYRFGASSDQGTPASMRVALSVGVSLR